MTGLLEEQLPVVMAGDPNLVRFVGLVDPIASELYERVGEKEVIFDPTTAPPAIVRWLAGVLAVPLEDDLPIDVQRAVVSAAAELFPRRGTAGSLRGMIATLAQAWVTIDETGWVRYSAEPAVPTERHGAGVASSVLEPPTAVRIVVGPTEAVSEDDVRAIIERELRADVPYELTIRQATAAEVATP